jgi:TRAP-type mannitol/chloroaromatic compound transport system substrate-binding protein
MSRPGPAVYIALEKGVIDADGSAAHANDHANGLRTLAKPPIFPGIDAAPILQFSVSRIGWDAMTAAERTILRARYGAAYGNMRRILGTTDRKLMAHPRAALVSEIIDRPPGPSASGFA